MVEIGSKTRFYSIFDVSSKCGAIRLNEDPGSIDLIIFKGPLIISSINGIEYPCSAFDS